MHNIGLNRIVGQLSIGDEKLTQTETIHIASEIVDVVVNLFNLRHTPDFQTLYYDEQSRLERNLNNNIGVEGAMRSTFQELETWANRCGFDPRLLVKVHDREIKSLLRVRITMDLDATVSFINETLSRQKPDISELVNDNPSAEELSLFQDSLEDTQEVPHKSGGLKGLGMRAVPVSC